MTKLVGGIAEVFTSIKKFNIPEKININYLLFNRTYIKDVKITFILLLTYSMTRSPSGVISYLPPVNSSTP